MRANTPSRKTVTLTRRGRLVLLVSGAVLAGAAVVVPLLTLRSDGAVRPRTLVIPEGWRAAQVYAAVDKALALPPGSTKQTAAEAGLKLPDAAEGNPEGYLFPATYPVDGRTTPRSLLSAMVTTAGRKFSAAPAAAGAPRSSLTFYQAVTIASIVQAESATRADMGKVARVVFNRLELGMPLQMDSTLNYGLGRTTARTTAEDTRITSPYNSYRRMGLPPTPIDNPGEDALRAVYDPIPGDWVYFVTVKPGDTRFTSDYAQHQRDVEEFEDLRRSPARQTPARQSPGRAGSAQPGHSPGAQPTTS
ncbi:endolytic transglycosylase MltG [Streptomyces sp. NPDC056160]|uniref:endolytic transglycosylase MltG n=1 Tax=Streptomyces sp. NPDC056160 TaxID=3345731 RepID=UPI0035E0E91C